MSEVKNIYVVIQRRIVLAYPAHKSDDCAVAAFSDESKANAFSNTFNSYVVSIPLDTPHAEPLTDKSIFVVYSKNKDITVDYVAPASSWNIADGVAQKVFIEELNYTHRVYTYVFARDMKQAMEIATERFCQNVSQKGYPFKL
jgi:hypothetical protein